MRAYVGQTRSAKLIRDLARLDIGECTVTGEMNPRRTPWFHDNGAWRDHVASRGFNSVRWMRDIMRIGNSRGLAGRGVGAREVVGGLYPDFIVVPDIVFGGEKSLDFSRSWRSWITDQGPAYLAVQNGMSVEAVRDAVLRDEYSGLFVGGDDAFKVETTPAWVALARDLGLRVHVGRVGTPEKVAWARDVGVDSIDSSFPLFHSDHLAAFVAALRCD